MKRILNEWRDFINEEENLFESAKTLNEFPNDKVLRIKRDEDAFYVKIVSKYNHDLEATDLYDEVWGGIIIHDSPECEDYYQIFHAEAADGWGPFLYDVAIEIATKEGSALTADRYSVSMSAYKVWEYYFRKREDVKKVDLDPNKCITSAADDLEIPYEKNPLMKAYKKKADLLFKLKKAGKIVGNYEKTI